MTVDLTGGDVTVATVSGELDSVSSGFLSRHLEAAVAARPHALILDFAAVGFCSAAVLRVLVETTAAADSAGVRWALVSDHRAVLRPIELTGLEVSLHPLPTVAAARQWLTAA
ncbi:STAS domain-containing protein [Lentzea sp. NBRC 102530]|uniref:STAS domain-containing protein n=1 Tax=Lentzea sp. NBRC 102530 TaxID=3032201 RepID=UPI0024A0C918|nr:STAS domain-containing protein [Lentzea sp. NBRC 102530]GLY47845.1 anti-sigma factor antagonist [Lentzea sp. NBRC 102530]